MSKWVAGINGPLIGGLGDVVGSSRKGVFYLKKKYKKRTTNVSKEEKQNQGKFAQAHYWLQPVLFFVKEGFKNYSNTCYGFAAAKSYVLLHAFEGQQPETRINPALVQVSYGSLPLSVAIKVELLNVNQLKFTWSPAYLDDTEPEDQVMLLAYDVENKQAFFTCTGQFRKTGSDILEIPAEPGKTYQIYFAFTAADRSRQSHSVYLGEVKV